MDYGGGTEMRSAYLGDVGCPAILPARRLGLASTKTSDRSEFSEQLFYYCTTHIYMFYSYENEAVRFRLTRNFKTTIIIFSKYIFVYFLDPLKIRKSVLPHHLLSNAHRRRANFKLVRSYFISLKAFIKRSSC